MTYKEKAERIGKGARVSFGKLKIEVTVLDYKYTYGRDRWLVAPVSGSGEIWIESFAE